MHNHRIFKPQLCDFQKKNKAEQPLSKDGSRLRKADAPKYGGADIGGPVNVASTKGKPSTLYYGNVHAVSAYFAIEITQLLGINTPKTRLVNGKIPGNLMQPNSNRSANLIAKGIPNLIPVGFMNGPEGRFPYQPGSNDIRRRYRLIIEEQKVLDKETHSHLRIAGHAYASFMIAKLIGDTDFQEQGYNFNLVRIGNRLYPVAIDKEGARFKGKTFDCLRWEESKFKKYSTLDQKLAVASAIEQSLIVAEDGKCDFDRVFLNSRVMATPYISKNAAKYAKNFKVTAQSMIDIFLRRNENIFVKFQQREEYRRGIADRVIAELRLPRDLQADELAKLIVEDLRGPYYQKFFADGKQISAADCDKEELLAQITQDFMSEFELGLKRNNGCSLQ